MRYLYAIIALGLLIAFHELGHLLAARLLRIKVTRFSVGFGPALFAFQRGATEYRLGAIPLGGYVRIHGMNPHEEGLQDDDPSSFANRRPWQRLLVLIAGSLANYLLAMVVLVGLHLVGTHVPVPMTIGVVEPDSAAARAQLLPGDVVYSVNDEVVSQWSRLVELVNDSPEQPLTLRVLRNLQELRIEVRPRDDHGVGRLGVGQQYVYRQLEWREAVQHSFAYTNRLLGEGLSLLRRLVSGKGGIQLSSPVGIVKAASDAASTGWDAFLRVLVSISVALALFNLLPFPALDGGRAAFVLIEAITRRRINPKLETALHAVGFMLLLALILWVATADVRRLISTSRNSQATESTRQ